MQFRQYAWLLGVAGMILAGLSTVGATALEPVSPRPLVHPAERTVGVVVTPDHVARPHPVGPFEAAWTLEGDAATTLRLQGRPEGRGKVRLIPSWPGCDVCADDDLELDPFDVPFLWYLIVEYPLVVC